MKGHLTAGTRGRSGEVRPGTLKTDESGTGAVSYTMPTDDDWQMIIVPLESTPECEQHPGDLVLAAEL
ncbi:hypothetical protein [Domibacillus iocasae]|uniref:hypothetical protein n=1 Tax=Domibacillus iocasae TaxID=1714016 RepID=UPI00114CBF70|nr:hypothetical protein [Domibacillus iocasae]